MLQHAAPVPLRVLLVDDDELISGPLLGHLRCAGIATDIADSDAAAELLLREHVYSVVLLDPYLTGNLHEKASALVDTVRRLQSEARIVILSAYGMQFMSRLFSDPLLLLVPKPQSVLSLFALIGQSLATPAGALTNPRETPVSGRPPLV